MISEGTKKKVIELYATGRYTITDICGKTGISREVFYRWKDKNPKFLIELKKAEKLRLDNLKEMATSGLATLLQGKEYEEKSTEYVKAKNGKLKIKSKKTVNKIILPNPASVIFTLKNLDPDNFQELIKQEHIIKESKPDWLTENIQPEENEE